MTRLTVFGALAACALAPATAAAATPKAGTFTGTTSQTVADSDDRLRVEIRVGRDGVLRRVRMGFHTACPDGSAYNSSFFFVPDADSRKVGKRGGFRFSGVYEPSDLSPGERGEVLVSGRGRFTKPRRASGTLSVTAYIFPAGSNQAMSCRSGKVSWSARR